MPAPGPRGPRAPGAFTSQTANRQPFKLVGQLLTGSGGAVVGATVYLLDWPSWTVVATTTSGSDGSYTFNPPSNGTYRCSFFLAGAPNQFGLTDILVPS